MSETTLRGQDPELVPTLEPQVPREPEEWPAETSIALVNLQSK